MTVSGGGGGGGGGGGEGVDETGSRPTPHHLKVKTGSNMPVCGLVCRRGRYSNPTRDIGTRMHTSLAIWTWLKAIRTQ
jgi:hypothetical protein